MNLDFYDNTFINPDIFYSDPDCPKQTNDNNLETDTFLLKMAFASGKSIKLERDYNVSGQFVINKRSCIIIDGNGKTITDSNPDNITEEGHREPFQILTFNHCDFIRIENLTFAAGVTNLEPIYPTAEKPVEDTTSSNTVAVRTNDCSNFEFVNVTFRKMYKDFDIKTSKNIKIDRWTSFKTLTGMYCSDVQNIYINNFNITMDPENTNCGFHAFYISKNSMNIRLVKGDILLESDSVLKCTPVFSCHSDHESQCTADVRLIGVKIKGHRIINVSNSLGAVYFEDCEFTSDIPKPEDGENMQGQSVTYGSPIVFKRCNFKLDSKIPAFSGANDANLYLDNCQLTDQDESGSQPAFLMVNGGNMKIVESEISWRGSFRSVNTDSQTEIESSVLESKIGYGFKISDTKSSTTLKRSEFKFAANRFLFYNTPAATENGYKIKMTNCDILGTNNLYSTGSNPTIEMHRCYINDNLIV